MISDRSRAGFMTNLFYFGFVSEFRQHLQRFMRDGSAFVRGGDSPQFAPAAALAPWFAQLTAGLSGWNTPVGFSRYTHTWRS